MNQKRLAVVAATAVVALGMGLTGCGSQGADGSSDSSAIKSTAVTASTTIPSDVQVVNVIAKNFEWDLDKKEVKAGKPVELVVKGEQGFHGLTIDGTDISNVNVGAGSTQKLLFTPTKAEDLMIHCTIMCGVGHGEMHADLKVTD